MPALPVCALRRASLTLFLVALATAVSAQTLPSGVRVGPSMAGITEDPVPNG
jgi:hypothetical protein